MSTKTFSNVRTKQKHDIELNWLKAIGFTPLDGELIIYDVDETHNKPRLKIGDGEQNVNLLPFIGSDIELKSGTNVEINKNEDGSYTISATDTIYTLPQATEENLGGIKIGYTQSGQNYPVVLDTNGKAYVSVPWTHQNAFSKITITDNSNSSTIEADTSTDTLTIQVSDGLNATTNIAGDKFVLSAEVTKTYVDNAVLAVKNDLLNGAGTAYDTLKELGDLISENVNAIDALEQVAANKVDTIDASGTAPLTLSGSITGTKLTLTGSVTTAAKDILGVVKTSSTVTSTSGLTASPIINGIVYYKNTTYSNFVKSGSNAEAGLVPAPPTTAGTTKYLREDGTWTAPPNDTKIVDDTSKVTNDTLLVINSDATPDKIPEWYNGTAVNGTGNSISVVVDGSASGDYYLNTDNNNIYSAIAPNTWKYVGNFGTVTVDDTLNSMSTNPVQNKIVTAALNNVVAPNPYPLKFVGAATDTYTGRSEVTVPIPSGAKLLWSGNWSSGSITITDNSVTSDLGSLGSGNVSDYKFLLAICDNNYGYLLFNNGTTVCGGCTTYGATTDILFTRGFRATISGNTLTWAKQYSNDATATSVGSSTAPIVAIYGITFQEGEG